MVTPAQEWRQHWKSQNRSKLPLLYTRPNLTFAKNQLCDSSATDYPKRPQRAPDRALRWWQPSHAAYWLGDASKFAPNRRLLSNGRLSNELSPNALPPAETIAQIIAKVVPCQGGIPIARLLPKIFHYQQCFSEIRKRTKTASNEDCYEKWILGFLKSDSYEIKARDP